MSFVLFWVIIVLSVCSLAISVFIYYWDLHLTNAANYEMVRQNFICFPTLSIEAIAIKCDKKIEENKEKVIDKCKVNKKCIKLRKKII